MRHFLTIVLKQKHFFFIIKHAGLLFHFSFLINCSTCLFFFLLGMRITMCEYEEQVFLFYFLVV